MNKGICRLCKKEKYLCKKSHILPKHTYKILKEDFYSLYIDKNTIKNKSKQKDYSGKFESNILCENCEALLSESETYACNLIYRNKINEIKKEIIDNDKIIISGNGYDYEKIKLYFLSILWKSSIASDNFFENIKLNQAEEEEIRLTLLKKTTFQKNISIFLTLPNLQDRNNFDAMDILITEAPYKISPKGIDVYKFFITGQSIYFIMGAKNFNYITKDKLTIFLLNQEQTQRQRNFRNKKINQLFNL